MFCIALSANSASSLFRPRRVAQAIGGVFCWSQEKAFCHPVSLALSLDLGKFRLG